MLRRATVFLLFIFSQTTFVNSQTFDPTMLEGDWKGMWLNQTFSTTDSAFLNIDVNTSTNSLTMILDLDGSVFGGSDPDPATMTGNYDQNGFSVTGNSPTYGDMYFSGDAAGSITGRLPNVPNPSIDSTTLTGIYTTSLISLSYIVYFTGGSGTANGIINLNKDTTATGVEQISESPTEFQLYQNYPNPFNPTTNIEFRTSNFGFVSLKIYDVLGNEITTLVTEDLNPGRYSVKWNASNYSSGVYFYKISTNSFTQVRKMVLIK